MAGMTRADLGCRRKLLLEGFHACAAILLDKGSVAAHSLFPEVFIMPPSIWPALFAPLFCGWNLSLAIRAPKRRNDRIGRQMLSGNSA